jgi:hypothetical protein
MFHPKLLSVFVHGNTVLSVAQTQTLELLSALLAVSELLQLAQNIRIEIHHFPH